MFESVSLSKTPAPEPYMDFEYLRNYGISLLEEWASSSWTDFNTHDPGVTILEQVCYVLTDLMYRTQLPMEALLANSDNTEQGDQSLYGLHGAAAILSSNPVTEIDWRKKIIDIEGVQNAWVEPVFNPTPALHFHNEKRQIMQQAGALGETEPLNLRGIYRVVVERSSISERDSVDLQDAIYECVHAHRGLGEDFDAITVLAQQDVQLHSVIDVGDVTDVENLLADIYLAVQQYFSPSIPFYSLAQMLSEGYSAEDIYEGPGLTKGFIKDEDLLRTQRKLELRTSDILHELMNLAGVRGIKSLSLASYSQREQWVLPLADDKTPRLDITHSHIKLVKNNIEIELDHQRVEALFIAKQRKALTRETLIQESFNGQLERNTKANSFNDPLALQENIEHYISMMHQFPDNYGINAQGLATDASPQRRAQAKQLKAYLLLVEQLLANQFSQLAHAKDLLSWNTTREESYFSQLIEDTSLNLHELYQKASGAQAQRLSEITRSALSHAENTTAGSDAANALRHNQFLDHLLARVAENFTEYSLTLNSTINSAQTSVSREDEQAQYTLLKKLIEDKQAFLQQYPYISAARGSGFNYLLPKGERNLSGLEWRLRHKLGITQSEETFLLIEHILLRPMADDRDQQTPLLGKSIVKDPYSLQVTFVFPNDIARYQSEQFQHHVQQLVREETPAHLSVNIKWLANEDFDQVRTVYERWLAKRQAFWRRQTQG